MVAAATQNTGNTDAFRELTIGPWRVIIAEPFAKPFEEVARSLRLDQQHDLHSLGAPTSGANGRGSNSILDLPGTSTRLHVRPLIHGGALARLTGRRFLNLERPLAELRITAELARRGAPVPEPGFVLGRRRGWFWQAAFGSVHIERTRDGIAFLESIPDFASLEQAARAAGAAVRRLHDLGCCHADLHIKNLLIRESAHSSDVIIVDLDRARLVAELTPKRRMLELMRLYRSLQKRRLHDALRPRIRAVFFSAYLSGDRELRDRLLAHQRFERLRTRAHSLLYRRT